MSDCSLCSLITTILYLIPVIIALFVIPFRLISDTRRKSKTVAFFHPYCNAGGGGERVLWAAIRTMQKKFPDHRYFVYSGDVEATKEQILLKARQRFGIELDPANVQFVYLRFRSLVEARHYPRFTMLFQALAGWFLALEAWLRMAPDVFIDSMGYPLSLPVFRFAGSKVVAYVHYPTISCDMLDVVESRQETFNNSSTIAQSNFLSWAKLAYYRLFACLYWMAGKTAHVVMVNGSWTQRHITAIWSRRDVSIVYPPCDVDEFMKIESAAERILEEKKIVRLLSVGQIRPEKNHKLQLEVLRDIKEPLKKKGYQVELCIAGGCRNEEDEQRVETLKRQAKEMGIEKRELRWELNIPYENLIEELSNALISIHTMHNEHFGISVVEAMAASTVILSNDSGGPRMDIVKDFEGKCVGYLSITREEYAATVLKIVEEGRSQRDKIREHARKSLGRFSDGAFEIHWNQQIQKVL